MTFTAKFDDMYVKIEYEEHLNKESFCTSYSDFQEFLAAAMIDRDSNDTSSQRSLVDISMNVVGLSRNAFLSRDRDNVEVRMIFEEGRALLNGYSVPTPRTEMRLLLAPRLEGELVLTRSHIWMVKNGKRIHYFTPNVYSSGVICWGKQTVPSLVSRGDYQAAHEYFFLFMGSRFNGDLPPEVMLRRSSSLSDYFQALSEEDQFPYGWFN